MEQDKSQFKLGKLEIGLIVVVLLGVVGVGFYSWRSGSEKEKSISSFAECVAAGNPVMESFPEQCAANGQTFTNTEWEPPLPEGPRELVVSDWGVKMTLSDPISDAHYGVTQTSSNTIWLSTYAYDDSAPCAAVRTSVPGATAYHAISRGQAGDEIDVNTQQDGMVTYAQAAAKYPDVYRQIGDYYYVFNQGNGVPCNPDLVNTEAFQTAFQSITTATE